MAENRIDSKFKKIWCYVVFFFALICCGFVFNATEIDAETPTLSVVVDKRDEVGRATGFSIYVGYGDNALKELK